MVFHSSGVLGDASAIRLWLTIAETDRHDRCDYRFFRRKTQCRCARAPGLLSESGTIRTRHVWQRKGERSTNANLARDPTPPAVRVDDAL
jgi:hypothetical protein